MARITTGSLVTDIRGKIGGLVFQRGSSGLIARIHATPVNPRTNLQSNQRSSMFYLQSAWQQLTDLQRSAWNTWAQYQHTQAEGLLSTVLSGQQAFIQVNRYRILSERTTFADPVFTPYSQPQPTLAVEFTAGTVIVTLADMTNQADYYPFLYLSPPLQAGRRSKPTLVRLMAPAVALDDTTWEMTVPYRTAFGTPPIGTHNLWYTLGLQQNDNGALSVFTSGVITTS